MWSRVTIICLIEMRNKPLWCYVSIQDTDRTSQPSNTALVFGKLYKSAIEHRFRPNCKNGGKDNVFEEARCFNDSINNLFCFFHVVK